MDRLLTRSDSGLGAKRLFNDTERYLLSQSISETNATANLLGRARVRERWVQALRKHEPERFAELQTFDGGTCQRGQTAAQTGCIPDSDDAVGEIRDVDPHSLVYREEGKTQSVEALRKAYPDGDYPTSAVLLRPDGKMEILDGHNRAAAARKDGHTMRVAAVTQDEYRQLNAAGYNDAQISHATLSAHGDDQAQRIESQFPHLKWKGADGLLEAIRENRRSFTEVKKFAPIPPHVELFDEPEPRTLRPMPPAKAVAYFRRLVPTIGVTEPERFGKTLARKAFTLAADVDAIVLDKVKGVIQSVLETGRGVSRAPSEIEALLTGAGVSPRNPQYAEMVQRTNMMDAYNTGFDEEMKDPDVADVFPVWKWLGIRDGRQRPSHEVHFDKYFPNNVSFAEVRDSVKGSYDGFQDRCGPQPVDKWTWADLQKRGAKVSTFAEGTCKPGQRADLTGCVPGTNDPAADNPATKPKDAPEVAKANQPGSIAVFEKTPDGKYGKSKAKADYAHGDPDNVAKTDEALRKVLGKDSSFADVASIVGAPDDAAVSVRHSPKGNVYVKVKHKAFEAERLIGRDTDGKLYIENKEFWMKEEYQGSGIGSDVFGRQVEQAREMGAAYIKCHAAKENPNDLSKPHNGYYTWPRMGYDMSLSDSKGIHSSDAEIYQVARESFGVTTGAKTVLDVMSTKPGRDWWKEHGTDMLNARFDLTPGSRSLKVLDAYLEERKARPGKHAEDSAPRGGLGVEELYLTPEEEAALEAVWERLEAEGFAESFAGGTCKRGETAKATGCIPASGDASQPTDAPKEKLQATHEKVLAQRAVLDREREAHYEAGKQWEKDRNDPAKKEAAQKAYQDADARLNAAQKEYNKVGHEWKGLAKEHPEIAQELHGARKAKAREAADVKREVGKANREGHAHLDTVSDHSSNIPDPDPGPQSHLPRHLRNADIMRVKIAADTLDANVPRVERLRRLQNIIDYAPKALASIRLTDISRLDADDKGAHHDAVSGLTGAYVSAKRALASYQRAGELYRKVKPQDKSFAEYDLFCADDDGDEDLERFCMDPGPNFRKPGRCPDPGASADSAPAQSTKASPERQSSTQSGDQQAPKRERSEANKIAKAKIAAAPVPSREEVKKARAELEAARRGEGRAGGESRGGSAASRRKQRENLFTEFGGAERGYVVCPWTGIKMHWTDDPKLNPKGYPKFERGKIFVKAQGGGYQLANLIPESFAANRSRNDATLRKENLK